MKKGYQGSKPEPLEGVMDRVNVAVTMRLDRELLEKIAAVHPRVRVWDIAEQVRAENQGEQPPAGELDDVLRQVEVLFCTRVPQNLPARAPRLRWVQTQATGVEHMLGPGILRDDVVLTNASGAHAIPIAEYVLGTMLMFVKLMPQFFAQKQKKQWQFHTPTRLWGRTVGVVGLGSIGEEVARLARAFGMRVVACRRSQAAPASGVGFADELLPAAHLHQLLAQSDFVALCVPLTPQTTGLMGEAELRAMKPTAYLINISRGKVVDEPALVRALQEGWIAGAALDVVTTEPLPEDSELWEMPNVILTPHVSGIFGEMRAEVTELFCRNLKRYLDGEELFNVVDRSRGY
jgi:phosphoglycerate dehydrogenase-like enzyme